MKLDGCGMAGWYIMAGILEGGDPVPSAVKLPNESYPSPLLIISSAILHNACQTLICH